MLTNTSIKALKPKVHSYRVADVGGVRGLNLQVLPSGLKRWVLRHTTDGKERFAGLGFWPSMSPQDARSAAEKRKTNCSIDTIDGLPTVSDMVEGYLADMDDLGRSTTKQIRSRLNKHVLPYIGDMPANTVTEHDVSELLARIYQDGHRVMANRVRSYLITAWKWAKQHDNDYRRQSSIKFRVTTNPVSDIPRDAAAERVIYRVLSWDEIRDLWHAPADLISPVMRLALLAGLATGGQRPSEYLGISMREIDLSTKTWTLPGSRTKNGRPNIIPLSDLAIDLLLKANEVSNNGDYIFSQSSGSPVNACCLYHAVRRYCNKTSSEKWSPKDLRTTFKTLGGSIGLTKEIRDRIQNHALTDVSSKHYDHYDYQSEKREAINKWCNELKRRVEYERY